MMKWKKVETDSNHPYYIKANVLLTHIWLVGLIDLN